MLPSVVRGAEAEVQGCKEHCATSHDCNGAIGVATTRRRAPAAVLDLLHPLLHGFGVVPASAGVGLEAALGGVAHGALVVPGKFFKV